MGDEAAWDQACAEAIESLHQEERAALLRIANGIGGLPEALLLAGSLHHADLFMDHARKEHK